MNSSAFNCLFIVLTASLAGAAMLSVHAPTVIEARQSGLPPGWSAVGCYSDIPASRTLRVASFTDVNNMTIESCLTFCTPAGYTFAGVEFARECYCDTVIESPGVPIGSTTCNMPCTGNPNEICGGAGGINIFQNSAATTTPPPPPLPPSGTIKQTAGSFQYKGCYQDGVDGAPRSLRTQLSVSGVTAESCTAACKAAGFSLAGLEFGQECWCDSYMPLAVSTPDTDCNMVCNADATELCGSGNRLAVYVNSSAPALNTKTCLNGAQLHGVSSSFELVAVFVPAFPGAPVSDPLPLGNRELAARPEVPTTDILTGRTDNAPHVYGIFSDGIHTFAFHAFLESVSIQPLNGGSQFFQARGTGPAPVTFGDYCAQPNPLAPSTYIGPPVLAVSGHSDVWGFCETGFLYLPLGPGNCSSILLEMIGV